MRTHLIKAVFLLSIMTVIVDAHAGYTPQQLQQIEGSQAAMAAQRNFSEFVQHNLQTRAGTLPIGFPLAVNDVQDLKDAKISEGFPVYSVHPKDILSGQRTLSSAAQPTGVWRFIISRAHHPIGLATVEKVNGNWQTVSYGAVVLAKDVDTLMKRYGNADHSNLRFIRVFQAQSDFLEVTTANNGKTRFAPLQSARESLLLQQRADNTNNPESGLIDANEFAQTLRTTVKANMANFR